MGSKFFLLYVGLLNAAAVIGCPIGQEFITAFMPNYIANDGNAKPTLSITAQTTLATVTVEMKGLNYKQTLTIEKGSTKYVTLQSSAEIYEDGVSAKAVLITSNTDISVVSSHIKPFTGDSSVIFPNHQLGKSHVAFTPEGGSLNKVMAIVNGKEDNTIIIQPYSDLQLKNKINLQRGIKMTIRLSPYQVYLLRSEKTLTGTRIESQLPVAVLAGHECLSLVETCEHVYEQLVPIESLSDEYLVPAMHPMLINQDTAHIVATEDNTDINIYHGLVLQQKSLRSGELLNVFINLPTVIRSNKKIMVMYSSSNIPFDEFLTNIIPVSQMSKSWTVYSQDNYQNVAVVVSEVEDTDFLFGLLKWNVFPANKKYAWTIKLLGDKKGPITISKDLPQAVYVYGGNVRVGYSTTGVCNAPSPPPPPKDPCESVKCRWREVCKKGVCVLAETATCWAVGDPHYKSFDGMRYDFQGTCTYTLATTVKTENGLVPFTILAKNNNRGSNLVAYVRTVSVNVYNYTIVASKQVGVVEVNGEITHLPVRLAEGKIEVVQSGWNALITTDFGLEVKYDWNMMLYITVPSTYSGSLGGLCGNYNGDRTDEQSDRKGTKLSTVLEFAKSWKVSDNDSFCHDDCAGKCLLCPPELKDKYNDDSYCGLITKTNGPFATCHKTIDPSAYLDNCAYDVCINKGIRSFLCDNMRTYAEGCMEAGVKIDPNWRMLSQCPLQCPENSHYESCGTACAASCAARDAASKCEKPCVEGCQCNNGFVLSGDKCVPLAQCGCTYENRYYPPADAFWGDQTCTKKCSCKSGQVTCTPTKCKASEVCQIQNGVRDCYPLSYNRCVGSGDPHYLTFDGRRFDFQGTCTYYLSKVVDTSDTSLVPFEVLVKNENRGLNKVVSYTKTVEIKIFGYTIILSKDTYGKVMVNNLLVNLPFEKEGGQLSVFRSGYFGVIKTDFGMNVKFNWDSYVEITLPSTYSNMVGGLCGNSNGNLNDDLMFPNKSIAKDPSAFGSSWKARNDPDCSAECKGEKCPKCEAADRNKDVFTKPCGLITDPNGPFKACHSKINPTKFYEDCVYDMCMYGGHFTALCSVLTAYTAACQTAQSIVEKWRTDSFCPASCKANSHYDVCGAGCPQTCNGFTEPTACQRGPCIEGCVCDVGFVLSNSECVPMEKCGCAYQDQYYNLGQVFYPKDKCSQKCVCEEQGKVTCKDSFSCGLNEQCIIRDGVQACYPDGKGSCSVLGSGTYYSYDGNQISVLGDCVYKLVEAVQIANQKMMPFSVTVQQVSSAVVVTRRINIAIAQYKIAMIPGLVWEIRVDEVKVVLPVTLEQGLIKVYQSGAFIILETSFGLKVTYDTVSMATVEIPSTYKKAVQGLCGNYNDNKADDFLMPDGNQASSAEKFMEAWMVIQEGTTCHTGCPPGSTCSQPQPGGQTGNYCKILTLEKGPFANCYTRVPPLPFYDTCVKDVASQPKDNTLVCRHIQNYVGYCQKAGISVSSWRNATFCPMTCPVKQHYELCADTCTSTCASLTLALSCPVCLEGCQCDEGFVFDGGDCKLVNDCGCLVEGTYYKSGESVIRGDCIEACTCEAGQFSCRAMNCEKDKICIKKDGIPTCMHVPVSPPPPPIDPCDSVKCRWREECRKGVCVRVDTATCWALGDPHYLTFDGIRYDFQGTCTYTMTTTIKTENGRVPFTILAKNNNRGSNLVAYVRTVSVNVYNHTIVASKQVGVVEVDGEITHLPVRLAEGKIEVVQSGWNALITTDFGLEVKYDWNMMLYITVPSTYFGSLGGLCGNYNGDRTDEQSDRKGTKLSTVLEFAKSWKVSDNDSFCHDDCAGKCLLCPPELKDKYIDDIYCGLIAKTNGPFATCHKTIDPSVYLDNCAYDVCINKGIRSFLCDNMRTYAEACMAAGVKIDTNWRMLSQCPLQCPENSHYESCGTACAASCAARDAASKCEKPCVEGCQCNNGFVLSGDKCVPLAQCGCTYENRYYPPADAFWGDQTCTKKCSCKSGQVTCTPTKCKASEVCQIQNGVRDCYPLSYNRCVGSGDPHYLTFDGRRFDFQGTCTYYLSKVVDTSDTSLVPFEVLVKNENRGLNKVVSYTKTVEIKIFGYTIILSKDTYGKVMVNNLLVNLPFEKNGGQLSVFRSGYFGVVKTDFGMNVKFNWDSYVEITLPSTYSNMVGGLCGNSNGNLNDDLMFPNKSIAKDPSAFGSSWKARNDPDCSAECKGEKCPKCEAADRNKDVFTKPCGLITDPNGPFKACHSKINPTKFYEDCVYDMCMYGGHFTALCSVLTAYTAACQTAQSIVEKWRTDSFCPASCKANSHYDVCGAGCPQTCNGFTEPTACQRGPCIEGCVCDVGFVLSNSECVPMEKCGCAYQDQYYNLGQVFYPKDKCSQKCVCEEQGKVTCKDSFSCGLNEQCIIRDGVQACYPDGKGSCSVLGSGTYHSYDGNQISVLGDCVYKLVETVANANKQIMLFSVTVQQVSSAIVVTRRINIAIAQYRIAMIPGLAWEIRVDEVKAILPVTLEQGLIKVYQSGAFIILETSFGLKVTYDTISTATVEIPSTYKNAVQGLCGNYNGNKADDFLIPGGNQASSAEKFMEAWMVIQEGTTCHTGCPTISTCSGDPTDRDNNCKILTLEQGPFANCYSKIPPSPFYDACVKDVTPQPEDKTLVCHHIQNYVVNCQKAGISVSSWRNATFCPMTCPEKSHYELCADTCTSTCASLTIPLSCPECLEGCQCDEGFVFDGGDCQLVEDCGCSVEGRYYKSGESVVKGDCMETCTCKAGQFSCQPMNCGENKICNKQDGIPKCMPDYCRTKKCREKEQCVVKDNAGICVATSKATCRVIGDPNYETFDGSKFSFQGTCSYIMVNTSGEDKSLTEFTIINKNELAHSGLGAYIKTVIIKFRGHEIIIAQNARDKVISTSQERTCRSECSTLN
ncbi:IgGFc-binding protein [Clarias gariepinus]